MDIVASNYGLAFSISPAKKRTGGKSNKNDDDDDEEYTLTLAPFTKPPKINFGQVKLNTSVERTVLIVNPQQFEVKLNVTNQDLEINNMELSIQAQDTISFKIKWQPEKPNQYKYSIMFEVTNTARLKFLVHAFGVCVAPPTKKVRKPLTMFQPVKKPTTAKPSAIVQPTPPAIVTNSAKTILKPAIKQTTAAAAKSVKSTITATIKPAIVPDKTFIVKETPKIGAKLSKTTSVDIYNLYNAIDDDDENNDGLDQNGTIQQFDLMRRQTCIIASPKIVKNKDGTLHYITNNRQFQQHNSNSSGQFTMRNMYMDDYNFKINEFQQNKTPMRRSLSSGGNLDTLGNSFSDASLVFVAGGIINHNTTNNYLLDNPKNYSPSVFSTVKKQDYNEAAANLTPKLADFMVKKPLNHHQTPKLLEQEQEQHVKIATQLNYDIYEQTTMNESSEPSYPLINSTVIMQQQHQQQVILPVKIIIQLQKQWRMKKFRQNLRHLKIEQSQQAIREAMANTLKINEETRLKEQEKIIQGFTKLQLHFRMKKFRQNLVRLKQAKLLEICLRIQRGWRMNKFRSNLKRLKMELQMAELHRLNLIIVCQRAIRMKLFRFNLNRLKQELRQKRNQSAQLIAKQWYFYKFRQAMKQYRHAAIKIQTWLRLMQPRFQYLNLKRKCIQIQAWYRCKHNQFKYKQIQKSVLIIQNWTRTKSIRFKYLKYKREKQQKYQQAAISIQKWHRSMKPRYEFLRLRHTICRIQALYRRVYLVRRAQACLKIQSAWRIYKARLILNQLRSEHMCLFSAAQAIQAYWRGYSVRKQTNQILNMIRNRLSCYLGPGTGNGYRTLGTRIRNSLKILSTEQIPIQQIMLALNDLDKVTCLSPECCHIFVKEGALKILYTFLLNCNRSVIHMDLIKMCLKVLINLAKYNETVQRIIEEEPGESLYILSNLLYAYHSSNSVIFMNACILFILLAQCKPLNEWLMNQETLIKKLMGIHSTLERRTYLKMKQINQINNPLSASKATLSQQQSSSANAGLNTSLAVAGACSASSLVANKKNITVLFHLEPEWSLAKKETIELVDPIGALEYFLNCLNIKFDQSASILKTPSKKVATLNIVKEFTGSASKQQQQPRIPFSQRGNQQQQQQQSGGAIRKIAFKQKNSKSQSCCNENHENNEADFTIDENQVSICSNESSSTIKSIANSFLNEEPKLNSTSISCTYNGKQQREQQKQASASGLSTKRKII